MRNKESTAGPQLPAMDNQLLTAGAGAYHRILDSKHTGLLTQRCVVPTGRWGRTVPWGGIGEALWLRLGR